MSRAGVKPYDETFKDLIYSSPTGGAEQRIAPYPSLKPQLFLWRPIGAAPPLGKGIILSPFMGSGLGGWKNHSRAKPGSMVLIESV